MKVIVFGTFDLIHFGHLSLFKQARKHGQELIVVVARDKNVAKIKKRLPKHNEQERLQRVRQNELVDQALLGDLKDPYVSIRKKKPDIICLGYDQKEFTKDLRSLFPEIKVIRLKPFKEKIYKTSKLQ